jgi:hypothetical protein
MHTHAQILKGSGDGVCTRDYWVLGFVHRPVFWRTLKNTTFRKLDLLPSSEERVGPLERPNLNHWTIYVGVTTATYTVRRD